MKEIHDLYNTSYKSKYYKFLKFFDSIQEVAKVEDVIPFHLKKEYYKDIEISNEKMLELDKNFNYVETLSNHNKLLYSLKRSKIDGLLLLAFKEIEKNVSVLNTLKSFNPKSSFANNVRYYRNNTLTGRLTVKSGPKILTLPSRCRSIIKSRFNNGSINIVDFKTLEPRVARYSLNQDCSEDIYSEIQENLSVNIDRSVIKRAVISSLYGSKNYKIESLTKDKIIILFKVIEDYFNKKDLLDVSKSVDCNGIRRNFFGRPIWNLEEKRSNVIINNYIQSTAVDLSLNYFYELVTFFDTEKAVPLYIIHDAIIFDVQNEYKKYFVEKISKGYENKLGKFYLDIKQINRRNY